MVMSKQQKRERAAQVHALGLAGSDQLAAIIAQLRALGEAELAANLGVVLFDWRKGVGRRCNELEGFVPHHKAMHPDYSAHLLALKRQYAARSKPPLRLVNVHDNAPCLRQPRRDPELPHAG